MDDVVHGFVDGVPTVKKKVTGDLKASARWKDRVIDQTKELGPITGPCQLDIEFVLAPHSFNEGHPDGPDLDNLIKSVLDALNETILKAAPGKDGSIVDLRARKRRARSQQVSASSSLHARKGRPGIEPGPPAAFAASVASANSVQT